MEYDRIFLEKKNLSLSQIDSIVNCWKKESIDFDHYILQQYITTYKYATIYDSIHITTFNSPS